MSYLLFTVIAINACCRYSPLPHIRTSTPTYDWDTVACDFDTCPAVIR